jgi:hypothetical protein
LPDWDVSWDHAVTYRVSSRVNYGYASIEPAGATGPHPLHIFQTRFELDF